MSWGVALRNSVGLGLGGIPSLLNSLNGAGAPDVLFDFAGTGTLDPRITFTRASSATYFDSAGTLQTATTNTPRFDYDPSTLAARGLLIEEGRTNLLLYSEQFNNAAWTPAEINVTSNSVVAPDGTTTADVLVPSTVNAGHFITQSPSFTSGLVYVFSVYAKANGYRYMRLSFPSTAFASTGRAACFDLQTGTTGQTQSGVISKIESIRNGWYRCIITATANATSSGLTGVTVNSADDATAVTFIGDGTSGISVWGAQLEAGAFPTSYIPTTTAAATRAADVATVTGANFSSWYNQTEGAFVVQAAQPSIFASSKSAASISDGTNSNRFTLYRQSAGGINAFSNPNGYVVAGPVATAATPWKSALSYGATSPASYAVNGASQTPLTFTVNPSVLTQLAIGNSFLGGLETFNGWISSFAYYRKRLSTANLIRITR